MLSPRLIVEVYDNVNFTYVSGIVRGDWQNCRPGRRDTRRYFGLIEGLVRLLVRQDRQEESICLRWLRYLLSFQTVSRPIENSRRRGRFQLYGAGRQGPSHGRTRRHNR